MGLERSTTRMIMNHDERFEAALAHNSVDFIPVFFHHLSAGDHLQRIAGRSIRSGFYDPVDYAKISLCPAELGFDNLMAGWGDILVEAQAFGTEIGWSSDDYYPKATRYGIQSPEDILSLEVTDPMDDEVWSVPLEAGRIMIERSGGHWPVVGGMNAPFVVASEVWGYENLLLSLMRDPGLAHMLLDKITESEMIYVDHLSSYSGIQYCSIENASAGADQNSPDLCREFDLGYSRRIVDRLKRNGLGVIVQNCTISPYIKETIEMLSPHALHFDVRQVSSSEIQGSGTCRIAGLDHENLLYKGEEESILMEVKRVIHEYGETGLMIAPAGELPFDTSAYQIGRFIRAVRGVLKHCRP